MDLLIIENTKLKHLRGFKNNRRFSASFAVHNTAIHECNVPERLTRIDGNLEIGFNDVLGDVRIP